jgi:hypothetical protein
MLIPKHHRKFLRSIGFPHWFWYPIPQWAYGDRYKFKDGSVVYLFDGEIVTIRKNARILWRVDNGEGSV